MTKFMFNTNFDEEIEDKLKAEEEARLNEATEEEKPPVFSLEQLENAKDLALKQGIQEGKAEMINSIERETCTTLETISALLDKLSNDYQKWTETINKDSVRLTRTILGKLAPQLMKTSELSQIEDIITEAFKFSSNEPRVLIRVSENLEEPLKNIISNISSRAGYSGEVLISTDPELSTGDCVVTWDAGTLERALSNTWDEIDLIINRVLGNSQITDEETNLDLRNNTITK